MSIHFYLQEQQDLKLKASKIAKWIIDITHQYNHKIEIINYILCSDTYLLDMNRKFLNHNYYTDVLTFNYSERKNSLEADIYISYERVKDNAFTLKTSYSNEFSRVILHGLLHLLGYKDDTQESRKRMRQAEDKYLSLLPNYVPRGTLPFLQQLRFT